MSDIPHGRFVWYELMTTDPEAAKDFYTKLIGWTTENWDDGPTPYTMWVNGKTSIGGLMQLPDEARQHGAPPHWLAYIATPSVDDTIKAAQARGATVRMGPMDIPTVGRIAVMADPQGAVFAVYTPASETPGHDGTSKLGEFSWHELATPDHAAAFDFYSQLFGWVKTEAMDMGDGYVSDVRPHKGQSDGRHVQQAERNARPAIVAGLRARRQRRRSRRPRERARRAGLERAHGRAGRRPHRAVSGSSRGGVRDLFDRGRGLVASPRVDRIRGRRAGHYSVAGLAGEPFSTSRTRWTSSWGLNGLRSTDS